MTNQNIKKLISDTFLELADALETGKFSEKVRIGVTTLGSEHGVLEVVRGAEIASKKGLFDVVLIGPEVESTLETFEATCESDAHKIMNGLLADGYIKACVTMHYPFPIGVATVGRVITPAFGKELILATTTGTSDTNRTVAMVKNTVYGIITAKALGIKEPTVGILNIDNARTVERILNELKINGYEINFSTSVRTDGGAIMRGNDLINPQCDIIVTDTLTGNLLMKLFSSFNTGGSYEALGYGYGPGIGFDHDHIVNIISRASGAPVIANALEYAYDMVQGKVQEIIKVEKSALEKAGFTEIINSYLQETSTKMSSQKTYKKPDKEVVSEEIAGIDILELEDALEVLLQNGIYAESGMGCTGPVILVAHHNKEKAVSILKNNKYL